MTQATQTPPAESSDSESAEPGFDLHVQRQRFDKATLYAIDGEDQLSAKVFDSPPDEEQLSKLEFLIDNFDDAIGSVCAWPEAMVRDDNGDVVGFLLTYPLGFHPLSRVFDTAELVQVFPTTNYGFLVRCARNLAAAVASLHRHGYMIGHLTDNNIVVGPDASVAFVECDGFQVQTTNRLYRSPEGDPLYQPPEVIGADAQQRRYADTDAFTLAVLIFRTLYFGNHPFDGQSTQPGYQIPQAIGARDYPFAADQDQVERRPDALAIHPSSLHPDLAHYFDLAFTSADSRERPTPDAWIALLDSIEHSLMPCSFNSLHRYIGDVDDPDLTCWLCDYETILAQDDSNGEVTRTEVRRVTPTQTGRRTPSTAPQSRRPTVGAALGADTGNKIDLGITQTVGVDEDDVLFAEHDDQKLRRYRSDGSTSLNATNFATDAQADNGAIADSDWPTVSTASDNEIEVDDELDDVLDEQIVVPIEPAPNRTNLAALILFPLLVIGAFFAYTLVPMLTGTSTAEQKVPTTPFERSAETKPEKTKEKDPAALVPDVDTDLATTQPSATGDVLPPDQSTQTDVSNAPSTQAPHSQADRLFAQLNDESLDTIKFVQRHLAWVGVYAHEIDGKADARVRNALQRWIDSYPQETSALKFTELAAAADVARQRVGWRVYRDSVHNREFYYPDSFVSLQKAADYSPSQGGTSSYQFAGPNKAELVYWEQSQNKSVSLARLAELLQSEMTSVDSSVIANESLTMQGTEDDSLLFTHVRDADNGIRVGLKLRLGFEQAEDFNVLKTTLALALKAPASLLTKNKGELNNDQDSVNTGLSDGVGDSKSPTSLQPASPPDPVVEISQPTATDAPASVASKREEQKNSLSPDDTQRAQTPQRPAANPAAAPVNAVSNGLVPPSAVGALPSSAPPTNEAGRVLTPPVTPSVSPPASIKSVLPQVDEVVVQQPQDTAVDEKTRECILKDGKDNCVAYATSEGNIVTQPKPAPACIIRGADGQCLFNESALNKPLGASSNLQD